MTNLFGVVIEWMFEKFVCLCKFLINFIQGIFLFLLVSASLYFFMSPVLNSDFMSAYYFDVWKFFNGETRYDNFGRIIEFNSSSKLIIKLIFFANILFVIWMLHMSLGFLLEQLFTPFEERLNELRGLLKDLKYQRSR